MIRLLFRLVCCLLACMSIALTAAAESDETYFFFDSTMMAGGISSEEHLYVHPDMGTDASTGSQIAPLQTITEALLRIYTMPEDVTTVTIWLREGTYFFEEPLNIAMDFGREVIIRAYPGETPVLTGARELNGWVETESFQQRIWSVQVDASAIRTLYGAEGAKQNARWPKTGTLTVSRSLETSQNKFLNQSGFYTDPMQVPMQLDGAIVRLVHWWKDELTTVRQYDPLSGYIGMSRPSAMTIMAGDMFWLENVKNIPLAAGEWYFDDTTRTLYYAPMDYETLGYTPLYVGMTETLMRMSNVHNLKFDGITFARTAWNIPYGDSLSDFPQAAYDVDSALYFTTCSNIEFSSCTFRDIGSGCIQFNRDVSGAIVFNCTFSNIGAQAIYIHGTNADLPGLVTESIVIENNEIQGYGRNFYNAAAILVIHARNVDIGFNEIHDGTYTAISAGWVWSNDYSITDYIRVRNNLIYNIGQGILSDLGAVYMLGTQANSVVSGNVIHDVTMAEYGGWGIYLDEGSSGIMVENNLVYRCSAQGIHQHNAGPNTVRNNIIAFNRDGQVGLSGTGSFTLSNNIVVGGKPYLKSNGTGTIRNVDNLFRESGAIFVDADNDNFNLLGTVAQEEIGFVPWVIVAGRYAVE